MCHRDKFSKPRGLIDIKKTLIELTRRGAIGEEGDFERHVVYILEVGTNVLYPTGETGLK